MSNFAYALVRYPYALFTLIYGWIHHCIILAIFLAINFGADGWAHWSVPFETNLFTAVMIQFVYDRGIVWCVTSPDTEGRHASTEIPVFVAGVGSGISILCLGASVTAMIRTVTAYDKATHRDGNDVAQIVLLAVFAFLQLVRAGFISVKYTHADEGSSMPLLATSGRAKTSKRNKNTV